VNELLTILNTAPGETTWEAAALTLMSAFALSQVVAFTYERTYEGMSYSRGFV